MQANYDPSQPAPCVDWECGGRLTLDPNSRGTCPECQMVQRLLPGGGLLEPDDEATHKAAREATAVVQRLLPTTPLRPHQDAPVMDGSTFERARHSKELASRGIASLRVYRERMRGDEHP